MIFSTVHIKSWWGIAGVLWQIVLDKKNTNNVLTMEFHSLYRSLSTCGQVCRMVCADWWWWLDLVPWTTLDHHPPPLLAQRHLCSKQPWPLVNIHPRSFHHSHTPFLLLKHPLLVGHQLPCKINKFRNSSPLPSIYFNFNYYPSYETPVLGWSCIFTVPFLHFFRIPLTCWFWLLHHLRGF